MKISILVATLLVIVSLVVGGLVGINLYPKEITKTVTEVVTQDKIVEVNKTIEVEVERDYKSEVLEALVDEISADKSLRKCDGDKYDTEEISIKKVYDGFSVVEDSDGDLAISGVKIKINYDDGDCYRTLTCGLDTENELVC